MGSLVLINSIPGLSVRERELERARARSYAAEVSHEKKKANKTDHRKPRTQPFYLQHEDVLAQLEQDPSSHWPCCRQGSILPPPPDRDSSALTSFFDNFLQKNSFSGEGRDFRQPQSDVQNSGAARYAAIAIGNLYSDGPRRSTRKAAVGRALQAYTLAIESLKSALDSSKRHDMLLIVESTMLMGIFEVRHEFQNMQRPRRF